MQYKFETENRNYSDFASGRVLYNQRGATAFPVRLGNEIYLRSKNYLKKRSIDPPYTIYDPCCGGAYLLTILALMNVDDFSNIISSDIKESMVELAGRNLSLLTLKGINKRIQELKNDIEKYNKDSHKKALESARRLKKRVKKINETLKIECFQANALSDFDLNLRIDLLITDLPYGNIVNWEGNRENYLLTFLNNIYNNLKISLITIITAKKQKIKHDKFNRIKHFTIGKRRISFLEPK
ncbi:MAG: hypothetical protein ACOCQS_02785 [Bacillota bacterium]